MRPRRRLLSKLRITSLRIWKNSLTANQARQTLASPRKISAREEIVAQARRILPNFRTHAKLQAFFHHWLQMDRVEPLPKDDKLFPGFTPEIIADLRTSLNLFLEDAVWEGSSDYRALLQADYLFLNNRL